jgi:hypothetical protein
VKPVLTILGQCLPAPPDDLAKSLPDTQAHVDVLSHNRAHAYTLQVVRIDMHQRTQHIGAKRICECGEALHGIQEYVRIVVLNCLQEYITDGGLECTHRLVWRGSCADGHQFA